MITWLGRVGLWLVFWPVGLWRSLRHGRRKDRDRIIREVRKAGR